MRRFVCVGLDTDLHWPSAETSISYRGRDFILLPVTEYTHPTICIAFAPDAETYDEASSVVRRFLSALSWSQQARVADISWLSITDAPIGAARFANGTSTVAGRWWIPY